jgi:hypothetical protein
MPVMLVLEPHSSAAQYAPLLSALARAGAQRVLRSAWVIHDSSTPDAVVDLLKVYLPVDDGYVVTEMGRTDSKAASVSQSAHVGSASQRRREDRGARNLGARATRGR